LSRGPPPKSMIKLYHLLRKVPFLRDEEIAEELGVKVESVRVYRWRLRKKLVTGVTYFEYCPECFAKALIFDKETGEIVCSNCGYVIEEEYPEYKVSSSLPFGTEEKPNTFALESNIAYGKSLGFTMPKKQLYRILARVNREHNGEAGLPVRQIQVITQTVDPPLVKRMLTYGSRLLKELGLDRQKSPLRRPIRKTTAQNSRIHNDQQIRHPAPPSRTRSTIPPTQRSRQRKS